MPSHPMRAQVRHLIAILLLVSSAENAVAASGRALENALRDLQRTVDQRQLWSKPDYNEKITSKFIARIKKEADANDARAQATLALCFHRGIGVPQNLADALLWYQMASANGHAGAQNNLACLYEEGVAASRDLAKAYNLFLKAARQGHVLAQFNVGHCYAKGIGTPKNYNEAAEWFRKAAAQGSLEAMARLGDYYSAGLGGSVDLETAKKFYRAPAEAGNGKAQFGLGAVLIKQQNERAAVPWLRRSAEAGTAEGQYLLAMMLYNGDGVKKDMRQAYKWVRKAAEKGLANAQAFLAGILIEDTTGSQTSGDPKEAERWARKAAEQENFWAYYLLGCCYHLGKGVERDIQMAIQWYTRAAEQKEMHAMFILGQLAEKGEGMPRNFHEAARWYRASAEAGHGNAQYRLGLLYRDGTGVEVNVEEAAKWLSLAAQQAKPPQGAKEALKEVQFHDATKDERQAEKDFLKGFELVAQSQKDPDKLRDAVRLLRSGAESGHPGAQALLAGMYRCGHGVPQDDSAADALVAKAANTSNPNYLYLIGRSYMRGPDKIPPQDIPVAISFFTRAAMQGYPPAQNSLGMVLMAGIGVDYDFIEAFKWFTLAADRGHSAASTNLERLRSMLKTSEIEEAKRRAADFQPSRGAVSKSEQPSSPDEIEPVVNSQ